MNLAPPKVMDDEDKDRGLMAWVNKPGDQELRLSTSVEWLATRMGMSKEAAQSLLTAK